MLSDHFRKVDVISNRTLFLFAGGLVIVCQLVAMALVSDGQVKKAQLRNLGVASQQAAFAQCLETSVGNSMQRCSLQVSAAGRLPALSEKVVPIELQANVAQASTFAVVAGAAQYGNAEGFALRQVTDAQVGLLREQSPSAQGMMPMVYNGQ